MTQVQKESALVLYDMEMQSASIPLISNVQGHLAISARGLLRGMLFFSFFLFCFLLETARPGCNIGTITLCLQKISK